MYESYTSRRQQKSPTIRQNVVNVKFNQLGIDISVSLYRVPKWWLVINIQKICILSKVTFLYMHIKQSSKVKYFFSFQFFIYNLLTYLCK